ncbi:hypothetical protein NBZ79_00535 [Sneathiella marina]|uniref:Tail assembly chaperone n=1 Tax=Sneathiella marina TaxID=2950108 RepID=A0ABY4W2Q5_9PROT|nr:hypothetical protein [Sneathiella marina]USG61461.1 hypothetical protein NBZ79_00535 [Sneathiella marina]
MTELHIDSKSVNYDRRSALKGAAPLPLIPFMLPNGDEALAAPPKDRAVRLWREWRAHKPIVDGLIDEAEETENTDISEDDFANLEARLDAALARDLELEIAVMTERPTTGEGAGLRLKTILDCEWVNDTDYLALFIKDLVGFGRLS